jgi:hypothetical protein
MGGLHDAMAQPGAAHSIQRRSIAKGPVLFLDLDVLSRRAQEGSHRCDDSLELLEIVVRMFPEVQVVLSSCVPSADISRLVSSLGEVGKRVVGTTADASGSRWDSLTRWAQIEAYVDRHGVTDWLALDQDGSGWPFNQVLNLVYVKPEDRLTLVRAETVMCRLLQIHRYGRAYPVRTSGLSAAAER